MHTGIAHYFVAVAAIFGLAEAKRPVAAANVTACVWHEHRPLVPYTVDWHPGSTEDRCMRLAGSAASMTVTEQGLTCQDLDEVAADSSGLCRILESRWSLSYTSSIAHSGSALTRWTAGKSRSDIVLREPAPGTTVCPSRYHCSQTSVEWGSYLAAYLHIIFEPEEGNDLSRGSFTTKSEDDDDQEPQLIKQVAELEI